VVVDESLPALTSVAEDFGHVLRGSPKGILRPRSVADVSEAVTHALSSRSRLTLRGVGHSAGGQALPIDSIVVDLSALNAIGLVDADRAVVKCEAGALLREVVEASLPHGLLPPTLTNLLDLTVGGLLSVGGIGPGAHRFGPIVANASALDVVVGDGSLHHCTRTHERDLYDAVLAGLGRCGVIVSAELELRRVSARIRTYYLLYDDHRRWLDDQRALAQTGTVTAMEGFCSPSVQGLRGVGGRRVPFAQWFFPLQVSFEFDDVPPELPAEVSPYRVLHVEDDDVRHFPARHDMRIEAIRRIGAWERPHPYIGAVIGADALIDVLPVVLEMLPLAEGHRGTFFMARNAVPPLMALPDTQEVVFFAVMYPQVLPQLLEDVLDASQRAADLLTEAGGKRYVADWLGIPNEFDWRRHFGSTHEQWLHVKQTFDPHGIFCSLLLP
jgi:cytokinin dehydrogenase